MRQGIWLATLGLLIAAGACKEGSEGVATTTSTSSTGGAAGAPSAGGEGSWLVDGPDGACATMVYDTPDLAGNHVDECSKIDFLSNPPTSGGHYPAWVAYGTYDAAIPWGYLLHNLEHGAIVLAYNCQGCDDLISKIEAFVAKQPQDPSCVDPVKARFIVVPDPDLDVPIAVAAWGAMLKAQCFDDKLVGAFVKAHYAKAIEDVCADGFDPTEPDSMIPAGCGD